MAPLSRLWPLVVISGFLVAAPGAAAAQDSEATEPPAQEETAPAPAGATECAATGYLAGSEEEVSTLRGELSDQSVHRLDGVALRPGETWVIPDGSQPVVVLDSTQPVSGGQVWVSIAGQEFEAGGEDYAEARDRYITNVTMPHLGSTVRSVGLRTESGECEVAVALSVDRSVWSTLVGGAAIAVTTLFGLLTVLVARLRKGGWGRRFGFAAPFGLIAGIGQGVLLVDAGVVSPFDFFPWWAPVAGLVLAALLPLTRWRRRAAAPAGPGMAPGGPPPQAPLAGFRLDAPVARTDVAAIYRASRGGAPTPPPPPPPPPPAAPGSQDAPLPPAPTTVLGQPVSPGEPPTAGAPAEERALVKIVLADRYGDPAARMRMEREAAALSGLEHPNVLKLRETVPAQAGPPTLVFEDVDGVPLRQLYQQGGSLTGAQVLNLTLGVLSGLSAVHAKGLVHRDVRPENVWLSADGRVLLAGLEVACAGVEHPIAPERTEPYASPEQRAGHLLDGRSDLYACAVMLRELMPAPVPTPVTQLLNAALSEDPAARPGSADQFAAGLRAAADQAYGPDWVGRGALAGALATHLAIGAAAGGYALAGGAAATGAGAAAAGAGAAATGIGEAALGANQAASLGVAGFGSGAPSTTTAGVTAAAAPAASAPASSGVLGVVANAAVAVAAGAAIVVSAVLVNPDPAEAQSEVINPDQARVIFARTVGEGQQNEFAHFSERSQGVFEGLLEEDGSIAESPLTEIKVGVPREQFEFPARFVASGLIPYEGGTASLFARFERDAADEDWQMATLNWSTDRLLPAAVVDDDGWLAPIPDDLLIDPATLPERYADWFTRALEDKDVGEDEVLELRFGSGVIETMTEEEPFFDGDPAEVSSEFTINPGDVEADLILLEDGTVQATFTILIEGIRYNRPGRTTGNCVDYYLFWTNGDPPGNFTRLESEQELTTLGWIPVPGMVPEPAPTASPTPSPTEDPESEEEESEEEESDEPAELELEPIDPERVLVSDINLEYTKRDGDPC